MRVVPRFVDERRAARIAAIQARVLLDLEAERARLNGGVAKESRGKRGRKLLLTPDDGEERARRLAEGRIEKAKKGFFTSGPCPYGYRRKGRRLVLEPEAAERIRLIVRMLLSGFTVAGIAREMEKQCGGEVHLGRRLKFSPQKIRYILTSPTYRGMVRYGSVTLRPGMHEAIIPARVWHKVQKTLQDRSIREEMHRLTVKTGGGKMKKKSKARLVGKKGPKKPDPSRRASPKPKKRPAASSPESREKTGAPARSATSRGKPQENREVQAASAAVIPICSACGDRLIFSARQRGDGLCGPCSRKANETQTPAETTAITDSMTPAPSPAPAVVPPSAGKDEEE